MADISMIQIGNTNYDLKDASARSAIAGLLAAIENRKLERTVELAASDWVQGDNIFTQSVTVLGVSSDNMVQVTPAPASISEWQSNGVYKTGQATDTLTFTAIDEPESAIMAHVEIWG